MAVNATGRIALLRDLAARSSPRSNCSHTYPNLIRLGSPISSIAISYIIREAWDERNSLPLCLLLAEAERRTSYQLG